MRPESDASDAFDSREASEIVADEEVLDETRRLWFRVDGPRTSTLAPASSSSSAGTNVFVIT
jgi:hypothetical protein